ncbi:hypothetical protein OG21DRAFT_1604540 [Imleria badia]|nr:hypothetical protein OG21DRAFT_1604540 [Imleria badia]
MPTCRHYHRDDTLAVTEMLLQYLSPVLYRRYGVHFCHGDKSNVIMYDALAASGQQYEEQTKKLNAVHHQLQAALEQMQKSEGDYAATFEQRTSELQSIQKFQLTITDTFSSSEVVDTLRELNEEAQQSTALWPSGWSRALCSTQHTSIERTRMSNAEYEVYAAFWDEEEYNRIPIEMVYRAYLIYGLHRVASS